MLADPPPAGAGTGRWSWWVGSPPPPPCWPRGFAGLETLSWDVVPVTTGRERSTAPDAAPRHRPRCCAKCPTAPDCRRGWSGTATGPCPPAPASTSTPPTSPSTPGIGGGSPPRRLRRRRGRPDRLTRRRGRAAIRAPSTSGAANPGTPGPLTSLRLPRGTRDEARACLSPGPVRVLVVVSRTSRHGPRVTGRGPGVSRRRARTRSSYPCDRAPQPVVLPGHRGEAMDAARRVRVVVDVAAVTVGPTEPSHARYRRPSRTPGTAGTSCVMVFPSRVMASPSRCSQQRARAQHDHGKGSPAPTEPA